MSALDRELLVLRGFCGSRGDDDAIDEAENELKELRARNAELERQLADEQEAHKATISRECRLILDNANLVQRITESQRQEPYAYAGMYPSIFPADQTDEVYRAYAKPLFEQPIVQPDVEEAVKAENECCVEIILAQDVDPAFKNRIADAIRARGGE